MKVVYNDGGRATYFKAKSVRDCVVRALSIVLGKDYKVLYNEIGKTLGYSPRNGVAKRDVKKLMASYGGKWVCCAKVGDKNTTHLADNEIPMQGRLICNLSKHVCAVVDGIVNDTYDPTRDGKRKVYGYWIF